MDRLDYGERERQSPNPVFRRCCIPVESKAGWSTLGSEPNTACIKNQTDSCPAREAQKLAQNHSAAFEIAFVIVESLNILRPGILPLGGDHARQLGILLGIAFVIDEFWR